MQYKSNTTLNNNNNNNNNNTNVLNGQSKPQQQAQMVRSQSRVSHVTRDINDSYAYSNVLQYIEENDLMPTEKAQSIRKWIKEVNFWNNDWEKRTIEKTLDESYL